MKRRGPTRTDSASTSGLSLRQSTDGHVHLVAPGTPYNEVDLSDSFLALPRLPGPKAKRGRRWTFLLGGLLGAFVAWLLTDRPLPGEIDATALFPSVPGLPDVSLADLSTRFKIGLDDLVGSSRQWLANRDFQVGRRAHAQGLRKRHAVVIIPGIVSSGLESWSTSPEHSSFFRQRIWGTTTMIRALLTKRDSWIRAMTLDPETGLDLPGTKVRSSQGLDAASYFMPGYFIWAKIIENLAALDYSPDDMFLAAYDWRLSYSNLQVRDRYFSQLKVLIDHNLDVQGQKTVLASHSMGALIVLYFFKWVESPEHGNGGSDWCERHIASWANIAGTLLGVPKAMAALLSGEMRDTVELNPAASRVLEMAFSRQERAALFRSWGGAASMWLKGGSRVWGDEHGAPDDLPGTNLTFSHVYRFGHNANVVDTVAGAIQNNLTMDEATTFLLQNTPASYQRMLASNWSFGFAESEEQVARNDADPRKWTNPLETRLPNAPSMKVYCLYGHGKDTERAYYYRSDGFEEEQADEPQTEEGDPQCAADDLNCDTTPVTPRPPLDLPLKPRLFVDSSISNELSTPPVRSGVIIGEGDGTVSVLSLGAMCVKGWQQRRYNPAGIEVVTRELKHEPERFDPRGGATTADHIDVLGATELNEAIVYLAADRGDLITERLHSRVKDYADKIRW